MTHTHFNTFDIPDMPHIGWIIICTRSQKLTVIITRVKRHAAEACSALVSDMQSFHVLAGSSDIRDLSNMHLRAGLLIVTHN